MHILYGGSAEALLRTLIIESMNNILKDFPTEGVRQALGPFMPKADTSLASLRVHFCLLLNQDYNMRVKLCSSRLAWYIPTLCPHKACNFYDQLQEELVPRWIRDENLSLLDLMENLRDSYLVS